MTQMKLGASHFGGRLFKSAATSALALSALAGGVVFGGNANATTWVPTGDGLTSTQTNDFLTPYTPSPIIGDKYITIVGYGGLPSPLNTNDLTFDVDPGDFFPWHVDLDMAGAGGSTTAGSFEYLIDVDQTKVINNPPICGAAFPPCHPYIQGVQFGANIIGMTAKKEIFASGGTTPIATLLPGETWDGTGTMYDHLRLKVTWEPIPGAAAPKIDNFVNNYQQSPGPLPILGAGAAFGFSRKLRGRIKASRTA